MKIYKLNFVLKLKFLVFFLLIFTNFLLAEGKKENSSFYFEKANKLYEKSNYSEAINLYLEIYNNGWISKDLLYNISNTYFRLGEKGKALLFIERAKKFSPRNSDISYNRKYLNGLYNENKKTDLDFLNIFTKYEVFNIFLFLNLLFWLFLVLKRKTNYFKNHFVYLHFIILFLMILMFFYGLTLFLLDKKDYAVILEPDSPCFAEPNKFSKALFTIPEAKKVLVLDNINSFTEIYLEKEELKGWIDNNNIEII